MNAADLERYNHEEITKRDGEVEKRRVRGRGREEKEVDVDSNNDP
jgi:hypothetical protein